MLANNKNTTVANTRDIRGRSIINLIANGSNVRAWESDVHRLLQMYNMNCLLLPDYAMTVSANKTLALDLEMQVERVIKAGRATVVAEARYMSAESAVAKGRKVKTEDQATKMPKLEDVEIADAEETKEKVEVEVNDGSMSTKERKMRARAKVIATRLLAQKLSTERRGAQHTVFFLDPLTGLEIDDDEDKEAVCHEHTLHDETMRYAVETTENAQVRMMLDDVIARSLSAIPAHVTTGVVTGNIHDRFQRVVLFFDDIGRKALIEQIDEDLGSMVKRDRESFQAFTSRFKDLEWRMEEQLMTIDPDLMLSKLERAINNSKDEGARKALQQVKLVINMPISTTQELLASMAEPMRDYEKDRKATQEKANKVALEKAKVAQENVNALHVGQRGGKGKGRGHGQQGRGRGGGKGANKAKNGICLKFAEGTCKRDNCFFNHVALTADEIVELKAKLTAAKAAKATGQGATTQHKSGGGHTASQVVNALKTKSAVKKTLTEKMAELRTSGLSDEQIIKVASVLLENQ